MSNGALEEFGWMPLSVREGRAETLAHMLGLMWPNPDRHETGPSRPPTEDEARHVLHLAVVVVDWLRSDALTLARVMTSRRSPLSSADSRWRTASGGRPHR